ncbi:MAG: DUF4920 domain-containing protein [Flavobacteriaceae bacterium]|nr:DUF4920 domain-containing protein [Flavobacteriaceae bacterium]
MKKIIILLFIFSAISSGLIAQNGKKYGNKLTLKEKTSIAAIQENPEKYVGKTVLVEGLIVDVCEARGCWIDIASDKEFGKMRFKVDDGVIVFPMDEKGKMVVAEGVFEKITQTKEQLIEYGIHYAKEHGTTFDPASITKGKTTYRLKGTGAVVK